MNKFKIGDRVRVYGTNIVDYAESLTGVITLTKGDILYVIADGDSTSVQYHYKQCRKLKKKEPKYLYINEFSYGYGSAVKTEKECKQRIAKSDLFKGMLKVKIIKRIK